MQNKITIALDMMSGDHGVNSSVPAAINSLKLYDDLILILVGDEGQINDFISDKTFIP